MTKRTAATSKTIINKPGIATIRFPEAAIYNMCGTIPLKAART